MATMMATKRMATEATVGIKSFHLFFIGVCVLLFAGLGVWRAGQADAAGIAATLQAGMLFLTAVGLVAYAGVFVRKLRDLSYM
jgi:hypothetical protein